MKFTKAYPDVARAYEMLGETVHGAGPLDAKTRALIKLALSIGARLEGAAHSHVRKALSAGVRPNELRHTAFLSLPTIGLPTMMAALSWIDEELEKPVPKRRRK